MILNPDGVWFLAFIVAFLSAGLTGLYLLESNKKLWAIPSFLVIFAGIMFLGDRVETYFKSKLTALTQSVAVKYKRTEPTKHGNKYYLTVNFDNGCSDDILVNYSTYREAVEGGTIRLVPTYHIYVNNLTGECYES